MKEKIVKIFRFFFPKKEKVIEDEGVLGHYESKPYTSFKYALIYADETEIESNEFVDVYSRVYRDTTFVNVLVNKEENFNIEDYKFENIKPKLIEKGMKETKTNIVFVIFQHKNDFTISQCKKFCNSTKLNFEHAGIFNSKKTQVDFYKPVPKFYKLYNNFCEDAYFDLAFIDDTRE